MFESKRNKGLKSSYYSILNSKEILAPQIPSIPFLPNMPKPSRSIVVRDMTFTRCCVSTCTRRNARKKRALDAL